MMNYLLTAKIAGNQRQVVLDEHETLNTVRKFMLMTTPMDETSADLKAMSFMRSVDELSKGKARAIQDVIKGKLLMVQPHNQ